MLSGAAAGDAPCAQTLFKKILTGTCGHSVALCKWLSWQVVIAVHACEECTRQEHLVRSKTPMLINLAITCTETDVWQNLECSS